MAAVGGFDAGFFPAWFEDVDLARRLHDRRLALHYWPAACFRHRLGSSVPRLGYGPFLSIYYRNLSRYLAKHHGRVWALAARAALVPGIGHFDWFWTIRLVLQAAQVQRAQPMTLTTSNSLQMCEVKGFLDQ